MAVTIKQLEKALKNSGGFVSKAASQLGITPSAVCHRVKKSERLQQVKQDAKETMLDLAESQLVKNIREGKEASVFFMLKTQGKERGYIERQEIDHAGRDGGPPININAQLTIPQAIEELKKKGIPVPDFGDTE